MHHERRDGDGDPATSCPTTTPLASIFERNIDALQKRRRAEEAEASRQDRLAEAISRFAGSMPFVYIHVVIVGLWVACNLGWLPGVPAFDPSFVVLATVASVEAIFLSTFVLISQNRSAQAERRRAELDLQINLLAEREVTRLISLTSDIARHLGVDVGGDQELEELEQDVAPEVVLDTLKASEDAGE